MKRIFMLCAIGALPITESSHAKDYDVDPSHPAASDTNSGEVPGLPLETLQAAIDRANPDPNLGEGDTIHVAKATYIPCRPLDPSDERTGASQATRLKHTRQRGR